MKKILLFIFLLPTLAFAQLELPFPIKLVNPKPVDFWYFESDGTPYDNTGEVTTQVLSAIRYIGQTFNVNGVEYWFKDGITDGDLIAKGGGSVDTTAFIKTQGESILTNNVKVSDVTGNKYLSINLGDQSWGTVPYSILSMGTINGDDLGYVTLQSGNTDQTLESTISLTNGVIEIISPIIKLKNTSTSGYVWTASGTDGTGGWAAPSGGSGANALGTYLVQTATNAPANAQIMGSLATGIVKNTTTTGVQSIAVAADFPTLNQNTTGNAATVTTNANLTGDVTSTGNATAIASGVIVNADINASAAIGATKLIDGSITDTELGYINTLSSNAQTQITAREVLTNKATDLSTFNSTLYPTTASLFARRDVTGTDAIVQADNGKTIYFNSGSPFNFTIDALTTNSSIYFYNKGSATVTFVDGSGVTSTGVTSLAAGESGGIIYESSTTPIILGTPSGGGGGLTVGTSTITSGTNTKVLYNNSGVLGEYTVSGTGNVALTTSPTFTTPALGTPSALVGTNITGTATGLTSGITNALKSATTTVDVSAATAPTSGQVLTATSGTAATWQTPASASGAWSLASGGTATGTNTFAMGSNPFILTSGVTTGTGATAGIQNVFNSLTTGNGLDISSSSLTTGSLVNLASTSTAAGSNTQKVLNVTTSGANGTSTQTTYGGYFSNTHTGTSATNVGLYSTASGGTTNLALSLLGGMKVQTGATGGDVDFLASGGSNWMRFDNTQIIRFQLGISSNNRITPQAGGLEFMSPGGASVGYKYNFLSQAALTGTSGTNVLFALGENASGTRVGSTLSSGTTTNKMLLITGAWNFTGSYSGILQSIDIDPTLTSQTGLTYIALRSTAASGKLLWGGTTVTSGSVLADFQSTTLGIMMPRVTNIASVSTPVAGMIAYDAATDKFNFRQGSGWSLLGLTQALSGTQTGTVITSDANVTSTQSISAFSSTVTSAGVSTQIIYDPSVLSNNSTAEIEITVTGIKTDGTSSFSVSVKGLFRKDNSGTVTMDVAGTQDLKELTASTVVSLVPLVNSGYPSATLTMGASSGTYAIKGITKAIITKL